MLELVAIGGSTAAFVTYIYLDERDGMKYRDREIEVEREREREEEARQKLYRQPRKMLFQHITHKHPLVEVNSESVGCGSCGVCDQPVIRGWAYYCSLCNYYLHEVCSTALVSLSHCSHFHAQEIQSPVETTIISTFAHKEHLVKDLYSNIEYKCNHCFTAGKGTRFRCDGCKVDLHPICATCPTKISSFMHPKHDLELKTRRHFSVCDICKHKTKSNCRMYRCKACEFFVHPVCSQLPQHLMHDLHPSHPLQLRRVECSRICDAKCESKCERDDWCYECIACNVSIHISCVLQQLIGCKSNGKDLYNQILQLLILLSQN